MITFTFNLHFKHKNICSSPKKKSTRVTPRVVSPSRLAEPSAPSEVARRASIADPFRRRLPPLRSIPRRAKHDACLVEGGSKTSWVFQPMVFFSERKKYRENIMTLTNIMLICIPTKMSRIFFLDTFFSESQIAFSEEEKNLN